MTRSNLIHVVMLVLSFCICHDAPVDGQTEGVAGETKLLWQIGEANNNTTEFALAPDRYADFTKDGFFIVGYSNPKADWPYIHPGPRDGWAGGRPHTFYIYFALKGSPQSGDECRLLLDLVQVNAPLPEIRIEVNERSFTQSLPNSRESYVDIAFPATGLKAGNNVIKITTLSGSWFLYDSIGLEVPQNIDLALPEAPLSHSVATVPALVRRNGKLYQPIRTTVQHFGERAEYTVFITGVEPIRQELKTGINTIEALVSAVETETPVSITIQLNGKIVAEYQRLLEPVRKWKIYLLPHSHVDIGYSNVQSVIEQDHWRYFEQAIEASRTTSNYPYESQYKWNVEVLWAVEGYMKQASPEKRRAFTEAVKKGWMGLDALYCNELTGLCRPEELVRLLSYAGRLKKQYGIVIDSAMITDVPSFTWGLVPVLAQSGVKYLSMAPNAGARIGYARSAWDNRPFYWVSPCGKYKVLCWQTNNSYGSPIHNESQLLNFIQKFDQQGSEDNFYLDVWGKQQQKSSLYPYDMMYFRQSFGDNREPEAELSEFVRSWNSRYEYPKLVIATTRQLFLDFERRYGDVIPSVRGDFTPYWEDGAASSARETALNRAAAERLVQAETLWAMLNPGKFPAGDFYTAWRNVILYDEHTWGAAGSISHPDDALTKAVWKIKQAFALDADVQSHGLLNGPFAEYQNAAKSIRAINVFNTSSWARTDLVVVSADTETVGDVVTDPNGKEVPSQRLSTGELALLAENVPPFGAKLFTIHHGGSKTSGNARAQGTTLSNGVISVDVNETTGAVTSLVLNKVGVELVDKTTALGLKDYFYVPGTDPNDAKRNGPVTITVKEHGPLVVSLSVESQALGCRKLGREIRIIDGIERVDIFNLVDKVAPDYVENQRFRKQEGVHFGFALNVPDGVMRMDTPWAVVRPEADQIPGSCKNWFTVQRWVDISNQDYGVTWATVDAPLIEVGGITAETPWIKHIQPSQTFYSYVMNNYWFTNYKAEQEGLVIFRYSIMPHLRFEAGAATRFGIERSQPLIVVPAYDNGTSIRRSLLGVAPAGVIVSTLRPSEDGEALIVRLFNTGGRPETAKLTWASPAPKAIWLSNLFEEQVARLSGPIEMTPYEFVTLRVPFGR
jgi:alpha-mannosidase